MFNWSLARPIAPRPALPDPLVVMVVTPPAGQRQGKLSGRDTRRAPGSAMVGIAPRLATLRAEELHARPCSSFSQRNLKYALARVRKAC